MRAAAVLVCIALGTAAPALAQRPIDSDRSRSITDHSLQWPTVSELGGVLLLREYNTRVVVLGVTCLGLACGVVGSFVLLRKRALLGDAISHATLPGVGFAFLLMAALGGSGKWLPGLLAGAAISGVLGVAAILLIVHLTRIKEDAALGIVLSVFFGVGIALLSVIQRLGSGHAAGLNSFVYGKAASMLAGDALLIAGGGALIALVCAALFKELSLLCFDASFAAAQGWPIVALDVVLMALVVGVTVIGLQAVGLILIIALLVIPPAAARFWTEHLPTMVVAAAAIGAASGWLGASLSALAPRLPSGAIVVVVAGLVFALSLVFGRARGVLALWIDHRRAARSVARQHLLRALYELSEGAAPGGDPAAPRRPVSWNELRGRRGWAPVTVRQALRRAEREGLVAGAAGDDAYSLTRAGVQAAWRVTRNHRLWELYLITHADIAPSRVDRDADAVEHVLEGELVRSLELDLARDYPDLATPQSPHALATAPHGGRSPG